MSRRECLGEYGKSSRVGRVRPRVSEKKDNSPTNIRGREWGGDGYKKKGIGIVIKLNTFFPGEYLGPKKRVLKRVPIVRREPI